MLIAFQLAVFALIATCIQVRFKKCISNLTSD